MKIQEIKVKTVLAASKLPAVDYCVNPYVGCAHACVYCYACFMKRFTNHEEEWGDFLDVKINALEVLAKELSGQGKKIGTVLLGSVTDAYQPLEKKQQLTRGILEILSRHDFPISILTKSKLVVRDMDILKKFSHCEVGLTITSLDEGISRIFEPAASSPAHRLAALSLLHDNQIKTYAFVGPILPGISDLNLIISELSGKIDYLMFEALNYQQYNREKVKAAYQKAGLDLPNFSQIDWDEIEKEARELSKKYNIPVKGFFRH